MSIRMNLKWALSPVPEKQALVCRLKGKLIGNAEGYEFLEGVRDEVAAGVLHVILDFEGLTMVNSAGLGILASVYTSTKKRQGTTSFAAVSENLQRLMKVSHLADFVTETATVDEALEKIPG